MQVLILYVVSGVQVGVFESLFFVFQTVNMCLLVVRNFIFYYSSQSLCLAVSDNRCSKYCALQISI
jgi:hypothetical protein